MLFDTIQNDFFLFLKRTFSLQDNDIRNISFELNVDEQKQDFGDINSNAALALSKLLKQNPKAVAQQIIDQFRHPAILYGELAGPGFINFWLSKESYINIAVDLLQHPVDFFRKSPNQQKANQLYSVEFVSANPTGPLHLGHGRGGIIGDVLSNILLFLGYNVVKEFYINDAGTQIERLGNSFKVRCLQALGKDAQIPEGGYQGEYLKELAGECIAEYGEAVLKKPDDFFCNYAKEKLLERIKQTLKDYGITFDVWFSEKTLHNSGAITKALETLTKRGNTYEKDGALWFNATAYGDDKDRVLRKANGELTYIAADIAYLQNKINRGAQHLIMILGQDHHSYVVRLKAIAQALGYDPNKLDVILYQLVTISQQGEALRMSKRAGTMVTLREVIDTVGKDVARFFFLNRKADAHLDFDLALALKKTEENPVYYIQYAYVRTKSILEKAREMEELADIDKDDAIGIEQAEHLLIKKIISLKELLKSMSNNYQTHLLTYYVLELAHIFHSYYSKNRVIDPNIIPQSRARLLLILLLKNNFELCLDLLGLDKPEKM